jgi:hypothetical protein
MNHWILSESRNSGGVSSTLQQPVCCCGCFYFGLEGNRMHRVAVRHSSPTAFFVALSVSIMGRYSVGVLNIPVIDKKIIYCLVV